jgi:hypothetical protein
MPQQAGPVPVLDHGMDLAKIRALCQAAEFSVPEKIQHN